MNLNTKERCINSLTLRLFGTSHWRKGVRLRFPNDARNALAERTLAKLATDAKHLTDSQWESLRPFFHWASERWNDSVAQAARNVEFKPNVDTLDEFIENLISVLTEQRAAV